MDNETKITVIIIVIAVLCVCALGLLIAFTMLQKQYKEYIKELEKSVKLYEEYVDRVGVTNG